ncbi:hypothetical protein BC833DRAFT_589791 [Globomyces pollinis-pini]|nr:hypothetical protein BC833DRAFT_589791 [Globomyces pollinis-pini]
MNLLQQFKETLKKRDTKSLKRNLKLNSNTVDFTSNDYLGFFKCQSFYIRISKKY